MPYKVFTDGDKQCVHKLNSDGSKGAQKKCYGDRKAALAYQRALYAAEGDTKELETVTKEMSDLGLEQKEIDELTVKCGYEIGYTYVPWGITTFAEYDTWESNQEAAKELRKDTDIFSFLVSNIMSSYETKDKAGAFRALADEFAARLEQDRQPETDEKALTPAHDPAQPAAPDAQKDESLIERVVERVKAVLGIKTKDTDSGFMVYKEADGSTRWIARYSNNYRDQDNPPEIISSASHKEFVDKVEKGLAPLPELWIWHVKEWRIGKADWVAFDEEPGFALAGGVIFPYAVPIVEPMAKAKAIRVSHGMPNASLKRDQADPTIIVGHETREISPLPAWAAANKLTGFAVLDTDNIKEADMAIPKDKREALIKQWGISEEVLSTIEQANLQEATKAKDEGLESKETAPAETAPAPVTEPAKTEPVAAAAAETEAPADDSGIKELKDVILSFKSSLDALHTEIETLKASQKAAEEQVTKAIGQTPTASILSMFTNQNKSAIGAEETRVDGRESLAKQKPAEAKPAVEGRTLVPFINEFLAAPKGQQ